jgi:hypothetical protein
MKYRALIAAVSCLVALTTASANQHRSAAGRSVALVTDRPGSVRPWTDRTGGLRVKLTAALSAATTIAPAPAVAVFVPAPVPATVPAPLPAAAPARAVPARVAPAPRPAVRTARPAPRPAVRTARPAPVVRRATPPPPVRPGSPLTGGGLGGVFACIRAHESGGNYTTNTGNGYYGAYQFSLPTWLGVGGRGLPSAAPPAEQDLRAQILQARYGWGQWSTAHFCGV